MIRQNECAKPVQHFKEPLGDHCGHPQTLPPKFQPLVSVKSVNGMDGDVVLKKLIFGEKAFNGTEDIELTFEDLGLGNSIQYSGAISTKERVISILDTAPSGEVYFCNENNLFYISLGDGEYKILPSIDTLNNTILPELKLAAEINPDNYLLTVKLLTSDDTILATAKVDIPIENYHDESKQDKLIAGKNIAIDNETNTITAKAILGKDLVTTKEVGGIAKGTSISAGTSIDQIIEKILAQHYIYHGIVNNIPNSVENLRMIPKDADTLINDGFSVRVSTDNQYAVLALDKALGITCKYISVNGYNQEFIIKDLGDQ